MPSPKAATLATAPALILCGAIYAAAQNPNLLEETYKARVIRVIDGDTFKAEIQLSDGISRITSIRILSIDAPEIKKLCDPKIRQRGEKAKTFLKKTLGKDIWLRKLKRGKYAGRMLAEVFTKDGVNIAETLQQQGLARPYQKKRWC